MKRTLIPTAVAIAVGGAMGFAALPASATPHDKNKHESSEQDAQEGVTVSSSVTKATAAEYKAEPVTVTATGVDSLGAGAWVTFDFEFNGEENRDWWQLVEEKSTSPDLVRTIEFRIPDDFTGTITLKVITDDPANAVPASTDLTVLNPDGTDPNAEEAPEAPEEDAEDAAPAEDAEAPEEDAEPEQAPAERQLVIDPEKVSAADFVKEDKGVAIGAAGFDEGEVVTLVVTAGPESVEGVTLTEVADENGVATFAVYGTNASQPSVYVGSYEVEVTGGNDDADGEDPLTGSFEVVSEAGGSDGGEAGGSDSKQLPRTGAELGGLGFGLGLLVAGGAAVLLSKRRAKAANGPADV